MNLAQRAPLRIAAAAVFGVVLAAAGGAETIRNHFDFDSIMRAPGFFDLEVLGPAPAPARWIVLTDVNPPSTPNKLAQVEAKRPDDSIAAAVRRTYAFDDGRVTTFVKRGGSRAGLLLRMTDEKNFLVLLVDTMSGDVVLTAWRGGKPEELGRGHAAFSREWEKFGVDARGTALTVLFEDKPLFQANDSKPAIGRTGLVAAGPGEASFDEFVLEFQPKS